MITRSEVWQWQPDGHFCAPQIPDYISLFFSVHEFFKAVSVFEYLERVAWIPATLSKSCFKAKTASTEVNSWSKHLF